MTKIKETRIHATCISQGNAGILIRGSSGSGKSDLALRLIDNGAQLVADDQVTLQVISGNIIARPPTRLTGLIEVRGIGILRMASRASTHIRLVVDLTEGNKIERLPSNASTDLAGVTIQKINLWAFEISAVSKVRLALDLALSRIIRDDE